MATATARKPRTRIPAPKPALHVSPALERALANMDAALAALRARETPAPCPVVAEPTPAPASRYCSACGGRGGYSCDGCDGSGWADRPRKAALAPAPVAPWEAFDLTRHDGTVAVANPATGNVRVFRAETVARGQLEGRRIISILTGDDQSDRFAWTGFGFLSEFGVKPWRAIADDKTFTGPNGYVAILTESGRFAASHGLQYTFARA